MIEPMERRQICFVSAGARLYSALVLPSRFRMRVNDASSFLAVAYPKPVLHHHGKAEHVHQADIGVLLKNVMERIAGQIGDGRRAAYMYSHSRRKMRNRYRA